MPRLLKFALWAVGLCVGLMLVTGLAVQAMLSGSRIQQALSLAGAGLPVPVTVGSGSFSLLKWFQFQPTVELDNLRVGNPPGFSQEPMLQARRLEAQVALLSALRGALEVRSFALDQPELNVEHDRSGGSNLERFFRALSKPGGASPPRGRDPGPQTGGVAVDRFSLRSGILRFHEPGSRQPALTVRNLDLTLLDLGAGRASRLTFSAQAFESPSSRVRFAGRAGPLQADSLPMQGELAVELAPAEMPTAVRAQYFGDLLRDPPAGSRIALAATLSGDGAKTLKGQGKLTLTGLELGADRKSRLALRGDAPFQIAVHRLLATPSFELAVQEGSLQLGDGRWKGRADLAYDGARFRGSSSGAITGVDVSALLAAFASSKDAVFGRAEIPEYRLQFAGANADQMRDSLAGEGRIVLEKGHVALFDLPDTIRRHAQRLLSGESPPAQGQTNFARLTSRVRVQNRLLRFEDLLLDHPNTQVSGQGAVGFDRNLSMDLVTTVGGDVASLLGARADASGKATVRVPVKVGGTLDSPKLYPDIGRLARDQAVEKAKSLLDSIFKKKQ